VGHDAVAARPAWWSLTVAVVVVMGMWAAGVVALPSTSRRLVDLAGGIAVLATLIAWVRRNGIALACEGEACPPHDELAVRLIRSRRPLLPGSGGPEIRPAGRRPS
jgi:hypothetical protein